MRDQAPIGHLLAMVCVRIYTYIYENTQLNLQVNLKIIIAAFLLVTLTTWKYSSRTSEAISKTLREREMSRNISNHHFIFSATSDLTRLLPALITAIFYDNTFGSNGTTLYIVRDKTCNPLNESLHRQISGMISKVSTVDLQYISTTEASKCVSQIFRVLATISKPQMTIVAPGEGDLLRLKNTILVELDEIRKTIKQFFLKGSQNFDFSRWWTYLRPDGLFSGLETFPCRGKYEICKMLGLGSGFHMADPMIWNQVLGGALHRNKSGDKRLDSMKIQIYAENVCKSKWPLTLVEMQNKSMHWKDQLLLGYSLGEKTKELFQDGRMIKVMFGLIHPKRNTFAFTAKSVIKKCLPNVTNNVLEGQANYISYVVIDFHEVDKLEDVAINCLEKTSQNFNTFLAFFSDPDNDGILQGLITTSRASTMGTMYPGGIRPNLVSDTAMIGNETLLGTLKSSISSHFDFDFDGIICMDKNGNVMTNLFMQKHWDWHFKPFPIQQIKLPNGSDMSIRDPLLAMKLFLVCVYQAGLFKDLAIQEIMDFLSDTL